MNYFTTCYKCKKPVKRATVLRHGIPINCLKCSRCGEEYYTAAELIRHDIKTGRRGLVRTFGTVGQSSVIRIPQEIMSELHIKKGDFGIFEKKGNGIFIRHLPKKQ